MTAFQFRNIADAFTKSYVETALWSSTDNNDVPMDSNYSIEDIAESTLDRIVADCQKFQTENESLINEDNCLRPSTSGNPGNPVDIRAGHDFWLTRNGHGAGFWDGDWAEPAATELTNVAHLFRGCDLYIGDDGLIYAS